MRYRLMATYRGVPYEAGIGPGNRDVVLFAACPPPEELGFEPATGHWRKQVIGAEVDGLWESRPVGTFRGEPCIVLDDLGDRLHIAYLGTDPGRAAQLGYWQVDRGVFELLTPREEVSGLTEERVDRPLRWASPATGAPAPGVGPAPGPPPPAPAGAGAAAGDAGPTYPYGAPGWPGSPARDAADSPDGVVRGQESGWAGTPPEFPAASAVAATAPANATGEFPPVSGTGQFPAVSGTGEFAAVRVATGEPPGDPSPAGAFPGTPGPAWDFLAAPVPGAGLAAAAGPLAPGADDGPAGATAHGPQTARGRSARRQRVTTREIFCELADLAAIPRSAYALEVEVDGAMCLLANRDGYEVFVSVDGARHEVRAFADEEAAYFYLFGVLAAEAVRNGVLLPSATHVGYPAQ